MINSLALRCTVFLLGASKVDKKKQFFLRNSSILPTSENLGVKSVYPRELIIEFKAVYNVVSDKFYLDRNNVRYHWK